MPPFAGQVIGFAAGGELDSPIDQVANGLGTFLNYHSDHIFMAYSSPGNESIFNMGVE